MQSIVDKEGEVGREVRAIGDDSYDVGKGFVDKTLCWKGVGRVGEGIEVTAVLYEVHWRLLLTVLLFSVHLAIFH